MAQCSHDVFRFSLLHSHVVKTLSWAGPLLWVLMSDPINKLIYFCERLAIECAENPEGKRGKREYERKLKELEKKASLARAR